jgi:hypothetical protein
LITNQSPTFAFIADSFLLLLHVYISILRPTRRKASSFTTPGDLTVAGGIAAMWWTGVVRHSAGVSAAAVAAPSGVVTFLFTDIEGSTRWWEADAERAL